MTGSSDSSARPYLLPEFLDIFFKFIKPGILLLSLITELSDLLLQTEDIGAAATVSVPGRSWHSEI